MEKKKKNKFFLPGTVGFCWIDVHGLQHTSGKFCLQKVARLAFWPGSLHILILRVLFPLFPIPACHTPTILSSRVWLSYFARFHSEYYMLIINHWSPVLLDHVGIIENTHISSTAGFCGAAQKTSDLLQMRSVFCSEHVTWTYLESPSCRVSLPSLLNIHKSWTNVEKAQIPPANKFPDGKRRHAQGNQTDQTLIPCNPSALVKKDVGTHSPLFLCQLSDPSIQKSVFQKYHVTHREMPLSWRKDLA